MAGIIDYIAPQSPANAAKLIDRLWESMQGLKGPAAPLRRRFRAAPAEAGGRRMLVAPYLVYYRVDDAARVVRILTVRHGRQRQPRRFK